MPQDLAKRSSQRSNKGVPPARFEDSPRDMPVERSPTTAPILTSTPPPPPSAASVPEASSSSFPQLQPSNQQVPQLSQPQKPAIKKSESDQVKSDMEKLTRDFNKKMDDMRNEFSRQMHAMQELIVSSKQPTQPTTQQTIKQPIQQPMQQPMQQSVQPIQEQTQQPILEQIQQPRQQSIEHQMQQPITYLMHQTQQPLQQTPFQMMQQTQQPLQQTPFQMMQQAAHQPLQQTQRPLQQTSVQMSHQAQQPLQPMHHAQQPLHQIQPHQQMHPTQQPLQPMQQASRQTQPIYQPLFQRLMQPVDRQTPMSFTDSQQTIPHRHKKIYPLPIFSGLPEEWQTFAEAFESTTLEFEYSNLHNIMRLRDALKGRARDTVESLLASSSNVSEILEILEETFGRPEQLIKSQIQKVRLIPPIAEGHLESLVSYANKMSNMATFLKNARGEHHLANPTLLSELVAKLPTPRQMQWAEKCLLLERPPTIVDFSQWLNSLRRLANMVADSLPASSMSPLAGATYSRRTNQHANTASNPLPNSRRVVCVSVKQPICQLCAGECKRLSDCKTFLQLQVDDRWNKIKSLRMCFSCLKKGHQINQCYAKKVCGTDGCSKIHHRLLHGGQLESTNAEKQHRSPNTPTDFDAPTNSRAPTTSSQTGPSNSLRNCHADCIRKDTVLFQILPVKIYSDTGVVSTYAFVDDGANVTIMDKDLANQLGLRGEEKVLELQWLNEQTTRQQTEVVSIRISGTYKNAEIYELSDVHTSSCLALPTQSLKCGEYKFDNLAGLPLHEYDRVQPKLILSLAHAYLTVPMEAPRISSSPGPIAINTRLGWIVYGPLPGEDASKVKRALHVNKNEEGSSSTMDELNSLMKTYFDAETFGIKADVKKVMSKSDERAIAILETSTKQAGSRFESGLLWKETFSVFPDSYNMALKRLQCVERKMERDECYAEEYRQKMEDYLEKGYARELSPTEADQRSQKTFYLPHFGVKNQNKIGLRLVFDAAAEIENMSLNKALLTGPDFNQPLISILFKFRQAPIAVCGDIKEMFHQIQVRKEDQDSQRFLWRGGDPTKPLKTYVMERLIFGASCSPTIAQYIKNLNAQRYIEFEPRAVEGIVSRHYVDDYVDCFETEEEAIRVVKKVIEIHEKGGFQLRNIVSNSDLLKQAVGNAASDRGELNAIGKVERILGMHWMSNSDVFVYILKLNKVPRDILDFKRVPTKREVLSLNMSLFDPFGFLANFTVSAKLLMQALWKANIQWDEPLPEQIYRRWKMWIQELPKVEEFRVPRCYSPRIQQMNVDIHVFVDASEEAMAAVAYWRVVSDGKINIVFIAGKSSCAPTRFHTTPKLELQAAVMGVRLKESITRCHTIKVNRCHYWSDSHTVIKWIRSDHRVYKQYVANRVAEILEGSGIDEWRWCPGELNPADEATRARFPPRYDVDGRWKNGADFLHQTESEWPDEASISTTADASDSELRAKHIVLMTQQVCFKVPNINRFSNYCRLKRTIAWLLRYLHNLRSKVQHLELRTGELSADEESCAEIYLLKWVQMEEFSDEYSSLEREHHVGKNSTLKTLNPFIGPDGLLRVNGRIQRASCVSIEARQPIILPKDHYMTRLLIGFYHRKCHHINASTVMSEIRQRFWIPSLRRAVNSAQTHCLFCKLRRAKPNQPMMGPLPVDRVTPYVRPFSYTGLDFFGPINVTIRRQREKRWVALFTCLTVRAVHLEIAADLSSDACLVCIRNFINRRGVPVQIRSDNGTNFVGIAKELQGVQDFLDHDVIKEGLSPLGIKWIFNTPANPSEGGAWERLVQSVKKVLYMMLKEHAPRLETLQSFLIEAENMVNARPLTHIPVTPEEPNPLTPNHFLLGCANSTQTPGEYEPRLMCLRKQWRILKNLKNGMWRQWIREYLPELTRRSKWFLPSKPITVGCLVLICDESASQSQWKRGRITNVYCGKDGVARSADVQTNNGVLKRPIAKLAILDVSSSRGDGESSPSGSVHGGGDVDNQCGNTGY